MSQFACVSHFGDNRRSPSSNTVKASLRAIFHPSLCLHNSAERVKVKAIDRSTGSFRCVLIMMMNKVRISDQGGSSCSDTIAIIPASISNLVATAVNYDTSTFNPTQ